MTMIFNLDTDKRALRLPEFTYTGDYDEIIDDGKKDGVRNWRLRLLTSGTLTFTKLYGKVDVFLVGAGGGGGNQCPDNGKGAGGGGGGGCVENIQNKRIEIGTEYEIIIGKGVQARKGESTSAFGITAEGGDPGNGFDGGDGASGGGGGTGNSPARGGLGGVDGSDGTTYNVYCNAGEGKHETTREFGTPTVKTYIVGTTPMASNWLSEEEGGEALSPIKGTIYSIMTETESAYFYHDYIWDGSSYKETDLARLYSGGGCGEHLGDDRKDDCTPELAEITARSLRAKNGKPNTGAGGGGTRLLTNNQGTIGGSGIVIIRNARK